MIDNDNMEPLLPKIEGNNNNPTWSCYYYPELPLHCSQAESEKENKCVSESSSSSCDESDSGAKDCSSTPRTRHLRIKKKLRDRDRDNEIDYLLKRRSLKLSRQRSNGSSVSCTSDLENHVLTHKRVLSRQSSSSSIGGYSLMDSFQANPNGQEEKSSSPTNLPSIHQGVVAQLAKHLRASCDKILDMSVPFVLDSCTLWSVSEAVNELMCLPDPEEAEDGPRSEYILQVMFLADVLEQTPTLCISLSDVNSIPGNMDLTLFRNLQVLELRKIPPHMVSGMNTIRINLKKLKCTRCLDSLQEIFATNATAELLPTSATSPPGTVYPVSTLSMTLTSVWPELREIDVSFNRIQVIDTKALELTPSVEILNLSRNRISAVDYGFSRVLSNLTVLNLNYNQLITLPPVPPSVKILSLSNNYISSLNCFELIGNFKNLEVLDISQNMISDETQLESLRQLTSLKSLVCIGNPVAYLDNYRNKLCANLSRPSLTSKVFVLDNKKLSNSEVRLGLEKIKMHRPAPLIIQPQFSGSTFSPFPSGNRDRLCDLKSLTQSYDSNSSSVRSACRKKPKIREIVLLDGDERDTGFDGSVDSENRDPIKPGRRTRKGSSEDSDGSAPSTTDTLSTSEKSEIMVLETRNAIESLRGKYGNDNWLLRQAGCEVGKLLGISDKVTKLAALSQSLPVSRESTFYSAVAIASWNDAHETSLNADKFSDKSGSNSTVGGHNNPDTSEESIKQLSDLSNSSDGIGVVYHSCLGDFEDDSITGVNSTGGPVQESETDLFAKEFANATNFRFFQSGQVFQLSILDHFLFEIDPEQKDVILSQWDLKSLKAINEENVNKETETMEFRLSFDTMRKQLRERTFIMSHHDYKVFSEMVSPFLQVRTLHEFSEGFTCVRCSSQFSKGMADVKIVESGSGIPTEVPVCPNAECKSDMLIPLESIPLPNNESFNISEAELSPWGQGIRSSTPISGGLFRPNSLPKSGFFGSLLEAGKPSSNPETTNTASSNNNRLTTTANVTPSKSESAQSRQNGKSDSDIEVLSCDSSSIEVLGKNGESGSSSDIEVEEAVEISVPDFVQSGKGMTVPMTESNSSGSYAESICTTYERTPCPLLSISQQLSPPLHSSTSSSLISSSASTLTPSSAMPSPSHSAAATPGKAAINPIRYDYEDFSKVDHRLQLFCELSIFKYQDEKLLTLTKAMVITSSGAFLSIVIFSNKKIYFYKITSTESDKPEEWLNKINCFPYAKLVRLDVLIGRQGVGLDLGGKLHAIIFRDSGRTSKFIEFFLCDICGEMESPPLVRDLSQSQKTIMSPTNPISYFGVLRFALCEAADKSYSVSALVLTDQDLILVTDLNWLANRSVDNVSAKHDRSLANLRQVECLEIDVTFVKLVFELATHVFWDIYFETQEERDIFIQCLKGQVKDIPFISLSQPLEP